MSKHWLISGNPVQHPFNKLALDTQNLAHNMLWYLHCQDFGGNFESNVHGMKGLLPLMTPIPNFTVIVIGEHDQKRSDFVRLFASQTKLSSSSDLEVTATHVVDGKYYTFKILFFPHSIYWRHELANLLNPEVKCYIVTYSPNYGDLPWEVFDVIKRKSTKGNGPALLFVEFACTSVTRTPIASKAYQQAKRRVAGYPTVTVSLSTGENVCKVFETAVQITLSGSNFPSKKTNWECMI